MYYETDTQFYLFQYEAEEYKVKGKGTFVNFRNTGQRCLKKQERNLSFFATCRRYK